MVETSRDKREIQTDLLGETKSTRWVVFHDESFCNKEGFLYHGFLFVNRADGRAILDRMLKPADDLPDNYALRIHFKDIRGFVGRKATTALRWVELARDRWIPRGGLRFYCMGVDLGKINYDLYRSSASYAGDLPSKRDRVYRRFYEIGLNAALGWFEIEPGAVTHLYYDMGKQDIDRFNKSMQVCGPDTIAKPLENDCQRSGTDLSKFLQLTDVLLGSVRRSFSGVSMGATGQKRCVEAFQEVVEELTSRKRGYDPRSQFWRRCKLSFFPRRNDMTPEEFFERGMAYHKKSSGLYYSERKTHRQQEGDQMQGTLWENVP